MRIKLITANFGSNSKMIIRNSKELKKYNVDVVFYNDSNSYKRNLSMRPRLRAKIPKMLEWDLNEDYDYYIWVDSKFTLLDGIIEKLLEGIKDKDLCLFRHPSRSSIKDEAEIIVKLMKDGNTYFTKRYRDEPMIEQVNRYLSDKDFVDDKLFSCGVFMYSKELVKNKEYNLMKEWFLHNVMYSIQDQLSMPYLLSKFKTNYGVYDFDILDCDCLFFDSKVDRFM